MPTSFSALQPSASRAAAYPAAVAHPAALASQAWPAPASGIRLFSRDQEIFAEGDPADTFFEVISGAVRTSKLLPDGRRQINAFHLAGSMFGIEAGDEHRFCAEAIGDVTLRVFRRRNLEALATNDPALACRVVDAVAMSLQRAHDHMLLLGRKSAREKIASFILDLAERGETVGADIEVPMSRTDIADHLGLTIETVSRTLTQLQRDGLIELVSIRRIRLLNAEAVRHIGHGDFAPPPRAARKTASLPFRPN